MHFEFRSVSRGREALEIAVEIGNFSPSAFPPPRPKPDTPQKNQISLSLSLSLSHTHTRVGVDKTGACRPVAQHLVVLAQTVELTVSGAR